MKLWVAWATFVGSIVLIAALALVGCTPDGGCHSSVTGNDNTVTQACGGGGDHAAGSVTTPAPVIVPPTVITPIAQPAPAAP